jgi:hypothetical protein
MGEMLCIIGSESPYWVGEVVMLGRGQECVFCVWVRGERFGFVAAGCGAVGLWVFEWESWCGLASPLQFVPLQFLLALG